VVAETGSGSDGAVDGQLAAALEDAQRTRTMANRHPALLWISDETGMCVEFNESWLKWRGRTAEEEFGNGWFEGVHPDDADRCMATYLSHFAERTPFEMDYRLKRADGEYRLILDAGSPWYHRDGSFAGFVGSCLDITDHVAIRRALAESEELFRVTVASLYEGVMTTDAQDHVLSMNHAAEELLGRSTAELVGRSLFALSDLAATTETGAPLVMDEWPTMVARRSP
jgi:PAS domain S-box-containing protein